MKCKDCDVKIDVEDHIDKNMNGLCDICDKVCYSPLLLIVSITSICALGALLYFLRKRYYLLSRRCSHHCATHLSLTLDRR